MALAYVGKVCVWSGIEYVASNGDGVRVDWMLEVEDGWVCVDWWEGWVLQMTSDVDGAMDVRDRCGDEWRLKEIVYIYPICMHAEIVVSTVADFYGGINPSTLSGAIDIVVVERKDGELHCSPFHVRFGKLKLLRPSEKKVSITINGVLTNLEMKVGEAGEAFFVVETDDPEIASEYATSPIPQATAAPEELNADVLDLGESITLNRESDGTVLGMSKGEESADKPATVSNGDGHRGGHRARSASERPLSDVFDGSFKMDMEDDENYPMSEGDADPAAQHGFRSDIHANRSLYNTSPIPPGSPSNEWSWTWGGLPVKADENTELIVEHAEDHIEADGEGLSSTAVKSPSQISTLSTAIKATDARSALGDDPLTVNEKVDSFLASLPEGSATTSDDVKKPASFGLTLPLKNVTKVEMSLCGKAAVQPLLNLGTEGLKNSPEEKQVEEIFQRFAITYDAFGTDPTIVHHPDLVIRINGSSYYDWSSASILLISLLAFGKAPPLSPPKADRPAGPGSEPKKYSGFSAGLRQWWSRGNVEGGADPQLSTSPSKSAPLGSSPPVPVPTAMRAPSPTPSSQTAPAVSEKKAEPPQTRKRQNYVKTLRLTSDQLKELNLKKGVNTVAFSVTSRLQGTATCISKIFFWEHDVKVVISDVDGTITKSDALGHLFYYGRKGLDTFRCCVAITNIRKNGYQILYLTSRAIGQYTSTRDYLMKIEQGSYQLPDGPVIMSPDRLFTALHREVIQRKPEIFKIAALRDVKGLFGDKTPFYAGFGNRITDALAYRAVHIPPSRIFTIDPTGEVKLELLSSYKSSYIKLNDIVDQIFPHVEKNIGDGYGDFEFWRMPVPNVVVVGEEEEEEEEDEEDILEDVIEGTGRKGDENVEVIGGGVMDPFEDEEEDDEEGGDMEGGENPIEDLAERVRELHNEPF
ncbi:Lipin/Ned1/Smp2-domain-containing protein [Chytridium lagenaria]|nr:Lipin/Ned1/Smp2-domain-containing protein [Chytridium lagenaria]